jgi:arginyl-tRNA synthetase
VYLTLSNHLREALVRHIQEHYSVSIDVVLDRPPKIEMGEASSPVCFELAKRLKKAPRAIAQEIANGLGKIDGIARVEVAGAGYLNAFFDRAAFWADVSPLATRHSPLPSTKISGKVIVEHTSINPNKAAHIGHVRNAVLGDTMARVLRHAGHSVQVQNYIDNTGVQVADVVIGFLDMERRTPVSVKMFAMEPRFDYYCWDLYAKATHFFKEDKARAATLRGRTLKAIEEDRGEEAEVAQVVADAIVSLHLRTMARLGIFYELLARESEILHLKFWDAAFEKLKASGAIQLATTGKMAGCWIMPWKEEKAGTNTAEADVAKGTEKSEDEENTQDKIIVRSNGTVTYVGKDIAYQLWKFGLLGKDFHYRKWPNVPEGETVWATTSGKDDPGAPHFGEPASIVYNVIDARQTYLQDVVAEGLRRLGHAQAAERSIHLSYEIVALTPRCAAEMGYELTPEEGKKPYVEVSGRKGFGVKADDLLDKLEQAARAEIDKRHIQGLEAFGESDWPEQDRNRVAHEVAIGALRFFLLKFTRNAIIAFDFKDALSFEGETGPYCQYAVVRARNINRKSIEKYPEYSLEQLALQIPGDAIKRFLEGDNAVWELLLQAGSLDTSVDAAVGAREPAFVAKFAFQLAQAFNNFYHSHHILSTGETSLRAILLTLNRLVEVQLVKALDLLGIEAPEKM